MKIFGQVINKVGSLDQKKIRDEFVKTDTQTVVGHYKLSPTGLQLGYTSYALQWLKGQQQLVWPKDQATASYVLPHSEWQ
jgi:branched-chain amino acid transport system substrate-binding protein